MVGVPPSKRLFGFVFLKVVEGNFKLRMVLRTFLIPAFDFGEGEFVLGELSLVEEVELFLLSDDLVVGFFVGLEVVPDDLLGEAEGI